MRLIDTQPHYSQVTRRMPAPGSSPSRNGGSPPQAVAPEDSLLGLAGLFRNPELDAEFQRVYSEYVRGLIGAELVTVHEARGERPMLVASAAARSGPLNQQFNRPINELMARATESKRGARASFQAGGRQYLALSAPFVLKDEPPICVTAVLPPERAAFADPCFTILHLSTQLFVQRGLAADQSEQAKGFYQATMLVAMISRTNEEKTFKDAAFSLATELEKFFGCSRVALGTGGERRCKVHAISGMSTKTRSLGQNLLSVVMREAIAVDQVVAWPSQEGMPPEIAIAANQDDMLRAFDAHRVMVVPLKHEEDDVPLGAWALLWSERDSHAGQQEFNLIRACRPHVSSLVELLKASKPGKIRGWWKKSVGRRGWLRRLALMAGFVGVIALGFLPIDHRIQADCRIKPTVERTLAAVFPGRVYSVEVEAGADVSQGQLMARLDDHQAKKSLEEAKASREAEGKQHDKALADGDTTAQQLAGFKIEALTKRVERLTDQLNSLEIRAPFAGSVLEAIEEESIGVPVKPGDILFKIAKMDRMKLELAIPESESGRVREGMVVEVRLNDNVWARLKAELVTLFPITEVRDGSNVLIGEAELRLEEGDGLSLKPGMEGTARVVADKRPAAWVVFHRLLEYLRQKLW